ncbi:MAG: BlaI/MecI/CopY family transcriptional regulator [Bacteroidota bacterium]
MEELTKTEEKIMQILWDIKIGFVKDVIAKLPDPKPPYNTISSVVRILEGKGFVSHKAYGKTHEYFPIVSKMAYSKFTLKNMITNYFEGSYEKLVSFMVNEKALTDDEIKEISDLIEKNIPQKDNND